MGGPRSHLQRQPFIGWQNLSTYAISDPSSHGSSPGKAFPLSSPLGVSLLDGAAGRLRLVVVCDDERLFGPIIEREGSYKFLTYANRL
jgi:hypothetical protein